MPILTVHTPIIPHYALIHTPETILLQTQNLFLLLGVGMKMNGASVLAALQTLAK